MFNSLFKVLTLRVLKRYVVSNSHVREPLIRSVVGYLSLVQSCLAVAERLAKQAVPSISQDREGMHPEPCCKVSSQHPQNNGYEC